jgi:hypothetical protein
VSGIVVLDLALLVVVIVVVIAQIGVRRTARACRSAARATGLVLPSPREALDDRERLESSLAARLVAGEIDGETYRRRMGELAALEATQRRLITPPTQS